MCRIITASELANKPNIELSALFQKVSQELANSEIGSSERRNALASLENISGQCAGAISPRAALVRNLRASRDRR